MKRAIVLLLSAGLTATAQAMPTDKEIAACAIVEGDLSRLECYDTLAQRYGLNGPQAQSVNVSGNGKWAVNVETNPIDDSKTVTLLLKADEGQSRWGSPVAMIARCRSNETDLFIVWNDYLGSEADVLSRVGTEKARTRRWSMSTDSKATFHPQPIAFLKSMMEADSLVAQVTPYNESPVTAIFDIKGLREAIKPLRETCHW
ncbi:type VI secretion system-associated protein TagO [Marinobacterium sediminicola]|uniref:Type VI secretion system protein VasI n=1 Tax=Marinobacterium sediminicola TaxID=518898 RepID=A0ABY1S3B8_9GAMM|nr:type VI secretion system-associated protein TagO [Marinobacterium sediminicola]ULG68827.1 type VI secretion protein [Marinobacterium sediminicola]SMR77568.1 type VI secretion system protein VasI [Marinobacterium sediminicola]